MCESVCSYVFIKKMTSSFSLYNYKIQSITKAMNISKEKFLLVNYMNYMNVFLRYGIKQNIII